MSSQAFKPKPLGTPIDVYEEVAKVVTSIAGIQLGEKQKSMVENRLKKRMLEMGIATEQDYYQYFLANEKEETQNLISLLTTHHTYFFREFSHFQFLEHVGLKKIIEAKRAAGSKVIRIWSAACSRGQEVYSLSMFLHDVLNKLAPDFKYEIFGSDVDKESVGIARNGVYLYDEVKEIPTHYLEGNWARGTGAISNYVKAKKNIKDPCSFDVVNLMNIPSSLENNKFDIIFCRNVFIYFTPEQIKTISSGLLKSLLPHGYFFIGISESLMGLGLPVENMGPSIFSLKSAQTNVSSIVRPTPVPVAANTPSVMGGLAPLRVMCVDDSSSILTLLKKILTTQNGFEIVATAGNGVEAAEKLKTTKVDLMTLDIHMPEMDGLTYLKTYYNNQHPPVVVISSVSRENADLAVKCLEYGASDYVEKPALNNINERGEEIRMKLMVANQNKNAGFKPKPKLEQEFATHYNVLHTDHKLRFVYASLSDREKLKKMISEFTGPQPATMILFEGAGAAIDSFAKLLSTETKKDIKVWSGTTADMQKGQIYLADFNKYIDLLNKFSNGKVSSWLIFGEVTDASANWIKQWPGPKQILLEEKPGVHTVPKLRDVATDIFPFTSFALVSTEYLSKQK